jgi:glyoxylase I family protein
MKQADRRSTAVADEAGQDHERSIRGLHGVRYQTSDVQRAVDFYTSHLGFKLQHKQLPAFATVSLGGFHLLLSGPGASGSRPLPDGRRQEPGGWNRMVLHVTDVAREIERLKKAGLRFRNQMETGPAGRQIQIEDPDGNPIELFEPNVGGVPLAVRLTGRDPEH